ncbi:MAG TPA: class I SAM-dependent methyltransferase [Thiopseudomonas sp.]|nr:class I SAM-dependent methyltransferase [Thiopseudomonas sp.]
MNRDFFEHKANLYDESDRRISNVDNIASTIIANVNLNQDMHLMDFGAGTGLLLERIAPFVKKMTAVDISQSMNMQLKKKCESINCEVEILEVDLEDTDISGRFDGIISSMTMHHIKDIRAMFVKLYALLNNDGFIAIADLDKEDGNFHTEDTGVYHFGFEREAMISLAKQAGFRDVKIVDASAVHKPYGIFSVFLLTAKK